MLQGLGWRVQGLQGPCLVFCGAVVAVSSLCPGLSFTDD